MRARARRWLGLAAAAAVAGGCTEDPLTGVDGGTAPGQTSPTVELELGPSDLVSWRDTTLTGFVTASDASFRILANDSTMRGRILARFATIPDSILVDTTRFPVSSFDNLFLRLVVDTAGSSFGADSMRIEMFALTRPFVDREATWTEASAGAPWMMPGGDLGTPLGALTVTALDDTLRVPFDAVSADSILSSWRAAQGAEGMAVRTVGSQGRLRITNVGLQFLSRSASPDTALLTLRSAAEQTFIFDPPTPPTGQALRLGGLPGARAYLDFILPDTAGALPLRGSTINRAALILRPLAPPGTPFALSQALNGSALRLLADPFVLGPRTPIGRTLGLTLTPLDPDSLAARAPIQFDVTSLIQEWAAADPDSLSTLRVAIRPLPEGFELEYWEFGSGESAPADRPSLRIIVTPPVGFDVPGARR